MRRTQDESRRAASPILWLNLVCLDAPLVAIVWQELFARARLAHVPPASRVALFSTAWLIYLADRIGDSFNLPAGAAISLRQEFARSHRRLLLAGAAIAAIADLIAIPKLDRATLIAGAAIGAFSAVYLVVNHFGSRIWRFVPLKEIIIGFLFAAGVRASFGTGGMPRFGYVAILFALLCALNCISIAFWERELDFAQGRSSIVTQFPKLKAFIVFACIALSVICVAALFISTLTLPLVCIASSSALLAMIDRDVVPLQRDTRTALADIVLLTPVIALPFAG